MSQHGTKECHLLLVLHKHMMLHHISTNQLGMKECLQLLVLLNKNQQMLHHTSMSQLGTKECHLLLDLPNNNLHVNNMDKKVFPVD